MNTQTHMRTYVHTCINTYMHIYIHTDTYTYTQTLFFCLVSPASSYAKRDPQPGARATGVSTEAAPPAPDRDPGSDKQDSAHPAPESP